MKFKSKIAAFLDAFTICLRRWNKAVDWLQMGLGNSGFAVFVSQIKISKS